MSDGKCVMVFNMNIYQWTCKTHVEKGDERGCIEGAREEIESLRAELDGEKQSALAMISSHKHDTEFQSKIIGDLRADVKSLNARIDGMCKVIEHAAKFLESHATDSRQSWMMHEAKNLRKAYCKVMGMEDKVDQRFDPQGNLTLE